MKVIYIKITECNHSRKKEIQTKIIEDKNYVWIPCCDVRYDFRIKDDVRFVFTSSCL